MDNLRWRAYHALRKVAKMEGISVQQVVENIDEAIGEAYRTAKEENDREVIERWSKIPCRGELPTALELIVYLTAKSHAE